MDRKELLKEHQRFLDLKNISDCIDLIDIYLNYFFEVFSADSENGLSKEDKEAVLINQMIFTRTAAIKGLLSGITYKSQHGGELKDIIDPTIIASIVRNIFETVGTFKLIYVYPSNNDEKTILYNLWFAAGLNHRQAFKSLSTTDDSKKKLIEEQKIIEQCQLEIEGTALYKSLNKKSQQKINKKLKSKDYRIKFVENNVKDLIWKDFASILGFQEGIMDDMYKYFSLYSHPSNVSVSQFGIMFGNDKEYLKITTFNINVLFFLLSTFIKEYITLFPNVLSTFNKLERLEKITIEAYNVIPRNNSYAIDSDLLKL